MVLSKLALVLSLTLLMTFGTQTIVVKSDLNYTRPGNWIYPRELKITVVSPIEKIYEESTLPLNITIRVRHDRPDALYRWGKSWIGYSLDSGLNFSLEDAAFAGWENEDAFYVVSGILSGITAGQHTIDVYAEFDYGVLSFVNRDRIVLSAHSQVSFQVEIPDQRPSPSVMPTSEPKQTEQLEVILGVAIAFAGIGAGLGLLVYFKKHKR